MNCPHCGAAYEEIYTMGQVAPVAITTCACNSTGAWSFNNPSTHYYSRVSVHGVPDRDPVPEPLEPLKPTEEIVADMLDLLDELNDE